MLVVKKNDGFSADLMGDVVGDVKACLALAVNFIVFPMTIAPSVNLSPVKSFVTLRLSDVIVEMFWGILLRGNDADTTYGLGPELADKSTFKIAICPEFSKSLAWLRRLLTKEDPFVENLPA